MPDEKKKSPSGNDKRKARLAREEDERRNEAARRAAGAEPQPHVQQFLKAGEPPIGDPVAGVAWANDVAMSLLHAVLADPEFTFEKRLRFASDLIGKLGMLHAKAHVQKRLSDLIKTDEDEEGDDGLEPHPLAGTDS